MKTKLKPMLRYYLYNIYHNNVETRLWWEWDKAMPCLYKTNNAIRLNSESMKTKLKPILRYSL